MNLPAFIHPYRAPLDRTLTTVGLTLVMGFALGTTPAAYAQSSAGETGPTVSEPTVTQSASRPRTLQGLPKKRTGAATRGNGEGLFVVMAPQETPWLSLSESPSLLVYVGETQTSRLIEVVVETQAGSLVYDKFLAVPEQTGFFKIELDRTLNGDSLSAQEDYIWHVSLVVDEDNRSKDFYERGVLNRDVISSFVSSSEAQQLATAQPLERAQRLQAAGLWQEAAIALYDIMQDSTVPVAQRSIAQQRWQGLMQSLDLEVLASQPLPDKPLRETLSLLQSQ